VRETVAPPLGARFEEASAAVLAYLNTSLPLGFWSVTRYDGERQVYLSAVGDAYDIAVGDATQWSETMCQYAVAGVAPEIAPDAMAVPTYAAAPAAAEMAVGAFVGVPIRRGNGELFGTLCGINPTPKPAEFAEHAQLLRLLSSLLSMVLDADRAQTDAEAAVELSAALAETDTMTGLLNRRGWDRVLSLEQELGRRFGDPCTLLVLDLDGLKHINDTLGHGAGDNYICRTADVVRTVIRDTDIAARLGGDEFGIVATETGDGAGAALERRLADALRAAHVECSIGRAQLSSKRAVGETWQLADERMYEAKRRRKFAAVS
jgi:diguanylate cyclase (GGDEF)-like protein